MKRPSILVIDDEPDNFEVIKAFLGNQGYQLQYAENGYDAISALDTINPDAILLDVMMADIDGIEVCRQIKAIPKWRTVPITMITALNSKSVLADCLEAGANDFISKPVLAVELRARVGSMLRIKQQYDELQAFITFQEDMVRMIVHDLRNPLCNIILVLELLKKSDYSKQIQELKLNQIYQSAQSLQTSIDHLLKFALLESGKLRLNCKAVDLCDLIESVVSNLEQIAANKMQSLLSQFSQESLVACIDIELFRRVLENLLSNAIKFAPTESLIIVSAESLLSGEFRIQVIDFGPGVPEPLQQKIFEKYEIGTRISNVSQIGLGLAFCKMVVEAHGGTICVRNNQPKGAIFEINFGI